MAKILITGGAGFIGSALTKKLLENRENFVVAADNLLTGRTENLPKEEDPARFRFVRCDINEYDEISKLMLEHRFDYVFHYAAVVGVKRTLENPMLVLKDIKGIENILALSEKTAVKRFFFASSSEVYGEPVEFPQKEDTTPLNSRLPYAVVKNLAEVYCKSFHKEFGLNYTIFRFFNTYGPGQSEDFVMSRFMRSALKNEDITVYGDGSQSRTFCYVMDNIEATLNALNEKRFVNDTINIGSENEISILKLAETIIDITGSSSRIIHLPPLPEGDMTRRKPDVSRMKQLLKRNATSLEQGIQKILETYRS